MYYEIKTKRLVLRPLNNKDLDSVHSYASDEENTIFMFWLPNESKEETQQFLANVTIEWAKEIPSFYEFAIVLNEIQIGAIALYLDGTRSTGEMGWIISKKYWKKGYAFEAAEAVKSFAINQLQLSKLVAKCDYRNSSSYNLMEKLGFSLECDTGTRTYPKTGETVKELTYSMTINHT